MIRSIYKTGPQRQGSTCYTLEKEKHSMPSCYMKEENGGRQYHCAVRSSETLYFTAAFSVTPK